MLQNDDDGNYSCTSNGFESEVVTVRIISNVDEGGKCRKQNSMLPFVGVFLKYYKLWHSSCIHHIITVIIVITVADAAAAAIVEREAFHNTNVSFVLKTTTTAITLKRIVKLFYNVFHKVHLFLCFFHSTQLYCYAVKLVH
jgi:hypothetical protein